MATTPVFSNTERLAHDAAAAAGLVCGVDGRLLGGCVLIPGHARQVPQNE